MRMRVGSREELLGKRWIRPFAALLSSPLVWRFNRRGVARGVALGLFAGFAIPFAQTPFAAVFALAARANLPVAVVCTMVTNPLTMPFIYYFAYRAGAGMLQWNPASLLSVSADAGFLERSLNWALALAGPTYLGLLLFAVVSAALGWLSVLVGWRFWIGWRRRRRAASRRATDHAPAPSCHEFG